MAIKYTISFVLMHLPWNILTDILINITSILSSINLNPEKTIFLATNAPLLSKLYLGTLLL